jgi:septin family protein
MGSNQSKTRSLPKSIAPSTTRAIPNTIAPTGTTRVIPNPIAPTATKRTRQIPNLRFRVLVVGRANAGKTSILQRVCDTTESPMIYRQGKHGQREEVRGPNFVCEFDLTADQFKLDPSMDVSDRRTSLRCPLT